jgi:hypothetical protein
LNEGNPPEDVSMPRTIVMWLMFGGAWTGEREFTTAMVS